MAETALYLILLIFGGATFEFATNTAHGYTHAAVARAQMQNRCDVRAYIDDADPDGTNVRADADKSSRILKRIQTRSAAVVAIKSYKNGWFEIAAAKEVDGDGKTLFEGRGWIHASLLGMRVAGSDARLYSEAKKGGRVLMKLKPEESPLKLIGCAGDWVKVETGGKIGWLAPGGQCGNPLTTCP